MASLLEMLDPESVKRLMSVGIISPQQPIPSRAPATEYTAQQPEGAPTVETSTEAGEVVTSPSAAMPDERAMLLQQLQAQDAANRAREQRAIEYGQANVNQLEAGLNAPQDTRTDLSPLLALSDTWFGGNLQKGYNRPPSAEEVRALKDKNLLAIANEKQKLAELMSRSGGGANATLAKIALMRDKDAGTQKRSDERKISDLSSRLEKSGLSELDPVIKNIEESITGSGDIPGAGQTAILPDFAISREGQNVRNAVSALRNVVIKARAGSAVSVPEEKRMLEELGVGVNRSDAQLRTGIASVVNQLRAKKQNIISGYPKEVVSEFGTRGGDVSLPSVSFGKGNNGLTPDKQKRLEELRAKKARGEIK